MALRASLVNIGNGAEVYQRASEAAINRLRTVGDSIGQASQAVAKEVERPQREQLNTLLANDDYDGAEEFVNANQNRLLNSSGALENIKSSREAFNTSNRNKLVADQQFEDSQEFRGNRELRNSLYGDISSASLTDLDSLRTQVDESTLQDKKGYYDQINSRENALKSEAETLRQRGIQEAELTRTRQNQADSDDFNQLNTDVSRLMADGNYEGALAKAKESSNPRAGEVINGLVSQKNLREQNALTDVASIDSALNATASLSPFVQKAETNIGLVNKKLTDLGEFYPENGVKFKAAPLQILKDSLAKNGGVPEDKLGEAAKDLSKDFNSLEVDYNGKTMKVNELPPELISRAVESVGWRGSSVFDDVYGKGDIQGIIDRASADLAARKAKRTDYLKELEEATKVRDEQVDATKLKDINALINRTNSKSHPQYRAWIRTRDSILQRQNERAKLNPNNRLTNQ